MTGKEFYIENFNTFQVKLNGGSKSFLNDIRNEAIAKLAELEFPTKRNEEWKYTDVSPILKQNFIPAVNTTLPSFTNEEIKKFLFHDFDCHLLVFINGFYSNELSDIGQLPKGVIVGSLKKISKENTR